MVNCVKGDYHWLTDARSIPLLKWFIDPNKIITYEDCSSLPSDLEIYNVNNYVPDKEVFNKLGGNWHGYIWDGKRISVGNDIIRSTEAYVSAEYEYSWQQALVEGMGFAFDDA